MGQAVILQKLQNLNHQVKKIALVKWHIASHSCTEVLRGWTWVLQQRPWATAFGKLEGVSKLSSYEPPLFLPVVECEPLLAPLFIRSLTVPRGCITKKDVVGKGLIYAGHRKKNSDSSGTVLQPKTFSLAVEVEDDWSFFHSKGGSDLRSFSWQMLSELDIEENFASEWEWNWFTSRDSIKEATFLCRMLKFMYKAWKSECLQ